MGKHAVILEFLLKKMSIEIPAAAKFAINPPAQELFRILVLKYRHSLKRHDIIGIICKSEMKNRVSPCTLRVR